MKGTLMNTKKKLALLAASLLLLFPIAGCGTADKTTAPKAETRTVTDIKGNTVTLPHEVKKIAITPMPWASITYAMDGSSSRITAINPAAMSGAKGHLLGKLDPPFEKIDTSMIGQDFSINAESIAKAGIDTVILWQYQDKDAEKLKSLGIAPVMVFNNNRDNLEKSFRILGTVLGKEEKADKLCAYYDASYDDIHARENKITPDMRKKVMFLINSKLRLCPKDFIHDVIEMSGGDEPENLLGDKDATSKTITMEEIYTIDPDILFLSNFDPFVPDDFYENKIPGQDWSSVSAVKNRRVYKVPMGIYRWDAPGVETPLTMKWLAQAIQPDVFSDIDIKKETAAFYKDFMNLTLSEDDMNMIFAKDANANSRPLF